MKTPHIILLCSLALYSCQKKDTTIASPADADIIINTPTPLQTMHQGDTLNISASVSYPTELHGYEIVISDSATDEVYFDYAEHVHADHFDIAQTWTYNGVAAKTLCLKLTTEIDHDGTEASKKIYFKYQP